MRNRQFPPPLSLAVVPIERQVHRSGWLLLGRRQKAFRLLTRVVWLVLAPRVAVSPASLAYAFLVCAWLACGGDIEAVVKGRVVHDSRCLGDAAANIVDRQRDSVDASRNTLGPKMASHPYISGAGNITQMIGHLRNNFPATVTSDTVKKLGLASNNESYVINVLQFLKLIDDQGKQTNVGIDVMTKHDDVEFKSAFEAVVKSAYSDLFNVRGDGAWTMNKGQLIHYFRTTDKTSATIGDRQAAVFMALRELAGHQSEGSSPSKPKAASTGRTRTSNKTVKPADQKKPNEPVPDVGSHPPAKPFKGDMALTVRIEINLPAEGTAETYDAIFKSIKANLFP